MKNALRGVFLFVAESYKYNTWNQHKMPLFRGKNIVSPVSDYKDSVRAASRVSIILTDDVFSVDQVNLVDKDRVLLLAQLDAKQNGIYTWSSETKKLSRASDADSAFELSAGTRVYVEEGFYNARSTWVLTTAGVINPGITNINFSKEHVLGPGTQGGTYGNSKKTFTLEVDETGVITSISEIEIDVDGGYF